jgi:hypothetical protein
MPVAGRKTPNYKKDIVLNIVAAYEPVGMEEWTQVARDYRVMAKETIDRDPADVRRYFIEKLCNKNKKPTGVAAPDPITARAQKLYRAILVKSQAGSFGDSSDSEVEDDDDPVIEEDAVGEDDYDEDVGEETDDINGAGILSPDGDGSSAMTPVVRKRKISAVSSNKSKNVSNKRASAASALTTLANAMASNSANNGVFQMMQMFMQQQQMLMQVMLTSSRGSSSQFAVPIMPPFSPDVSSGSEKR